MRIRVPATSANLGPGFDSCGLAVSLYLEIEVGAESLDWEIEHNLTAEIPTNKKNLLIQTALRLAPNLTPHKIKMISNIPVARGLGSSSSVIVAGIELANRLGNLGLTQERKIEIATKIEGHPDNVAPAICGGFVVASYIDEKVSYVKHHFPDCDIIAVIPETQLLTSSSRGVLPEEMPYGEAVKASAISNVMIAAILNGNLSLAGKMMEKDLFHEIHRKNLIPNFAEVRKTAKINGGYGSFLSGAGPTVLILSPYDKTKQIVKQLMKIKSTSKIEVLAIEQEGVQVF